MQISVKLLDPSVATSGDDYFNRLNMLCGDDLLLGRLSPDAFIQKLSDTFSLRPISTDSLPRRAMLDFFSCNDPREYTEAWLVEQNPAAELFYRHHRFLQRRMNVPEPLICEDRICVFLSRSRAWGQFQSNADLMSCFLEYYRGIDPLCLEELGCDARLYLLRTYGMRELLADMLEAGETVSLINTNVNHSKYLTL